MKTDIEEVRSETNRMTGEEQFILPLDEGVGARHSDVDSIEGGGGYLDNCNKNQPALMRLRSAGITGKWMRIAQMLGEPMFLQVWKILDEENIDLPMGMRERVRLPIPQFCSWHKVLRNELIFSLSDRGMSPVQIEAEIRERGCEPIQATHIANLIRNYKNESNESA